MIDWDAGSGWLNAGGKRLEWGAFGGRTPGQPVIALLHEGLGCLALWRDFPAQLAEATGLPVFAWSRAGYGQSEACELPRPLDYMTREAVDVLPDVLAALGGDPVILMGHSDGATIAAIYGGAMADARLRGLVLLAPHFFTEEIGLREIAAAREAFAATDMKARMARYHRDPEVAFRGWNEAWLAPGFKAWNVADAIDGITVPMLAIQGREDQYGTLAQLREIKARAPAPVEVLELDACRHAPQFDQPEQVLATVAAFTSGLVQDADADATAAETD
ncbi:alpha/beta fold hydrolase [Aquicoccus sp. G2-2]|uniref:alpha/beta fold hydrolase n=1 Tax=Aquicoccus sp. G2-2 TaxID=3092120 RepID=UPI002AE0989F|nr:alpha/beta hydrolase [Aquicoccus sp. G2-2]MEA1114357.1 alpha/beta hydrolase [Aquicoccus sp. G2-2]